MIQKWKKHGSIYSSRAQAPTVLEVDGIWRIYFADRDPEGNSYVRYIDVEPGNPKNILYEHPIPVTGLDPGDIGSFDHTGVMPSWAIKIGEKVFLYYVGWSQRKDVPYHNSVGLAIGGRHGKIFKKLEGPILPPAVGEPYFTGTSCVVYNEVYDYYTNYYLSCTGWEQEGSWKAEPRYHIKEAISSDGINWVRKGNIAIDYKSPTEGGICNASVIEESGISKMWYCYRRAKDYRINPENSYRIGYAEYDETKDREWQRKDCQVDLGPALSEIDDVMQCYPQVLSYEGKKFMFYNGNGFGSTGILYATLD